MSALLERIPSVDAGIARIGRRILVRGAVQGVGFRPFVYREASARGLTGWVENSCQGVTIEVEGEAGQIDGLMDAMQTSPPPNAVIAAIETQEIAPSRESEFSIRVSTTIGSGTTQILPDIATCAECLAELLDPTNRRYLYPFTNCTHCGPRHSIVESIPYDRARTSMRHFPMCPACQAEYDDPNDRRFHAEANACPECGPTLTLWDPVGRTLARKHDALVATAAALHAGQIVAVKGIGGFHLMADARNEAAVRRLRIRKNRPEKPFAVMFQSLSAIEVGCEVSPVERALLCGPARPIVLLRRAGDSLAASVAPGNPWLGAMLPYAPLHHLLLREFGGPVVATSGNRSDEPIVTDEAEALRRLGGIADLFLIHDRPIVRPIDDSVVRVVCGRELLLRRARGFAPAAIPIAGVSSGILAVGGHLKSTFALTQPGAVILSQHIGDLQTVDARASHARIIADLISTHSAVVHGVAHDLHPDYASTTVAKGMGRLTAGVQHHLAHVVSCMAENGIEAPVLGVAWDGTGYGADGTIWGGEFIEVSRSGWRRVAHLRTFPLPGGEAAAREPRRSALGLLHEAFGNRAFAMTDLAPVVAFTPAERAVLGRMMERGVNAPRTSSIGRLFDAFGALCGLRQVATYEGQAAAELEGMVDAAPTREAYELPVRNIADDPGLIIDWMPALESVLADLRAGVAPGAISAALHAGLANTIVSVAEMSGIPRVALSGGCFQNAHLTELAVSSLRATGFEPFWHRLVPPNDGGIALGQAVWASWTENGSAPSCA